MSETRDYSVIVTTKARDAADARDLVRWALEAAESLGPCEVTDVPEYGVVVDWAQFERLRYAAECYASEYGGILEPGDLDPLP